MILVSLRYVIARRVACNVLRSNLYTGRYRTFNTNGYRDAGGQETIYISLSMQHIAEIASKQAASSPPRNDAFLNFIPNPVSGN